MIKQVLTWVVVKIVQNFDPLVVATLPWRGAHALYRATKNAHLRGPCLQLFSNLIRQDIPKKSTKVQTSPENFYKISQKFLKFLFQKLANHTLRNENFGWKFHWIKLLWSVDEGRRNKCCAQSQKVIKFL